MRAEEAFARDSLIAFLRGGISWRAGENPPDFYLALDAEEVAVEVTRLTPVTFDSEGVPGNRLSQDETVIGIVRELNHEFRDQLPADRSIGLFIAGPLNNPPTFKKALRGLVAGLVSDTAIAAGWSEVFKVDGHEVHAGMFALREHSPRRIICGVMNDNQNPYIAGNLRFVIRERVAEKDRIMSAHGWHGAKWLALVDDTVLGDAATAAEVYSSLGARHCFDRVFYVGRTGLVTELIGGTEPDA